MGSQIRLYFFLIITFLASSLNAATYKDGQAAYEANDYKKAVEIWETLAEQGDVKIGRAHV